MKIKNRHRKSFALRCCATMRFPLPIMVCSMVGCIMIIHFYMVSHRTDVEKSQARLRQISATRELGQTEEESFQLPPPRSRRSPRAIKRRGARKPPTVIDEFLDDSSELRSFFFPHRRTAVDPSKEGNDSMHFYPGRQWLDTEGNPIQAHGGGLLYVESTGTYYWYGENKDGPTYQAHRKASARVDIIGVNCYSSKDLWTWTNEGIVLSGKKQTPPTTSTKGTSSRGPRSSSMTEQGSTPPSAWRSASPPRGPSSTSTASVPTTARARHDRLQGRRRHRLPHLLLRRQQRAPRRAPHRRLPRRHRRHAPVLIGQRREAPAVFKHRGTYYMITSGCSGWAPNTAMVHAAETMMGPWETMGNPCAGGNKIFRATTFFSQGSFVVPLRGLPGWFIFMADRWNPSDLRDSRYVWLPVGVGGAADEPLEYSFGFPLWSRVSVYWHSRWRLPEGWRGFR
ncbi:unnamed protein product [Spirodela intermedia]|uniref:Uncharacterized protein n=1 Tax=Spirodela intermedia TaxID=51605 RepID=A0A7I8JB67_SPIIN|nr:unnamed protein product [Spirodela intermedia]CAA6667417.1 unnamed protein product [Spirodela intermedia]